MLVAGFLLLAFAASRSLRLCSFELGCENQSSRSAAPFLFGALGIVLLVGFPVVTARRSGRPTYAWVGLLAALASVAALVVGRALLGSFVEHSSPSALVLALGVAGAIAVRPVSRSSIRARTIALSALFALTLAMSASRAYAFSYLIPLTVLPAIGLADAFSGQRTER